MMTTQASCPKRLVIGLIARIESGDTLAAALDRIPNGFSRLYRDTLRAAEYSGCLASTLHDNALYLESQREMMQRIRGDMGYNLIYLILMGILSGVGLVFLPRFAQLFMQYHHSVPVGIQWLLALRHVLLHHTMLIVVMVWGVVISGYALIRYVSWARFSWDMLTYRVPILGPLRKYRAFMVLSRQLAMLYRSGVSLPDAMDYVSTHARSPVLRDALSSIHARLHDGMDMHAAWEEARFFHPLFASSIRHIHEHYAFDTAMMTTHDYFHQHYTYLMRRLSHRGLMIYLVIMASYYFFIFFVLYFPMLTMQFEL